MKTDFVPDQWDSIFENFDIEADQKEKEIREEELARQQEIAAMVRQILDRLEDILKKGPRYEMPKEIKELFSEKKEGFSGGDPQIYKQKKIYVKEAEFILKFKGLCENYEIDKHSYNQLLKRAYPADGSQTVKDMRLYLLDKRKAASYRPLKKMNYPLAAVVILLIFGFLLAEGNDPFNSLFLSLLVGTHWYFYRILYHRYGGPGSHMRISFAIVLILFFFERKMETTGVEVDGLIGFTVFYADFFVFSTIAWVPVGGWKHQKE